MAATGLSALNEDIDDTLGVLIMAQVGGPCHRVVAGGRRCPGLHPEDQVAQHCAAMLAVEWMPLFRGGDSTWKSAFSRDCLGTY